MKLSATVRHAATDLETSRAEQPTNQVLGKVGLCAWSIGPSIALSQRSGRRETNDE